MLGRLIAEGQAVSTGVLQNGDATDFCGVKDFDMKLKTKIKAGGRGFNHNQTRY